MYFVKKLCQPNKWIMTMTNEKNENENETENEMK